VCYVLRAIKWQAVFYVLYKNKKYPYHMLNYNIIKAYQSIILSYRQLQMSIAQLIEVSGIRHKEIWTRLGFTKDTFYRRLRVHDWKTDELQIIIPFLTRKVKSKDPELYQQLGGDAIAQAPIQENSTN
jgi:hypothetical protein